MENMNTVEIKAFVPSKDFDLSTHFYTNLGFSICDFTILDPTGVLGRIGQEIQ